MELFLKLFLCIMITPLSFFASIDDLEDLRETVTINHEFGTTEVPVNPKRVVALSTGDFETALALGIKPIATSRYVLSIPDEYHTGFMTPWVKDWIDKNDPNYLPEIYELVGFQEGPGIEEKKFFTKLSYDSLKIWQIHPDLIIGSCSYMSKGQYEQLSTIAPTIPSLTNYRDKQTWQEDTRMIAKALNKVNEGEMLISETEKMIKDKLNKYPNIQGKTVAILDMSYETTIDLPNQYKYSLLEDFGLVIPNSILSMLPNDEPFLVFSDHKALLDEVDIIVTPGHTKERAKEKGRCNPSVLNIPYLIDDYLNLINKSAQTVINK